MSLGDTFKTCLGIEKEETVLLVTDSQMKDISRLISEAVAPLTNDFISISMVPREMHGEEPPKAVEMAMGASDVVIGVTSKSLTHTKATQIAVNNGARVASMPGISIEMLTNGGMTADYFEVTKTTEKVARLLSNGKSVEIKTSCGTDFRADLFGREGIADTGLLRKKGDFGNLPGGEAFIAPIEDTSEGRIVFDGPIASSGLTHDPIIADVKDGRVTYTSSSELQSIFRDIKGASLVAEIGIGTNPRAMLIGNILEDEKVRGTAHVAFGNNTNFGGINNAKVHLDGIIKRPTVVIDGRVFVKEGILHV
jgi:leucyl aminopeptidase (aminopeptidase T)